MQRLLFPLLVLFAILSACVQDEKEIHEPDAVPGGNWMAAQRIYPYGDVDYEAIRAARAWRKTEQSTRARALMSSWESIGPTNVGGRISDLELSRHTTPLLFVGTASGGVWRSADRGDNWESVFDEAGSLSIGDIALAPSNNDIVYVGTGEANGGGGSLTYNGNGVWKSDDRGDSWRSVGLTEMGTFGRLMVHPNDENTVFAAASGALFNNGDERGLYRSTNGGDNWTQVLFVNDSTGFVDLAINPDNPDIIYAAAWQRTRSVNRISYGGAGSNIYRSEDGGDTWEILTDGLPSADAEKGRITLALAPSEPEIVYAYYTNANGGDQGFYRSANGGDTWVERNTNQMLIVSFMYWFGRMEVNPNDPEEIYFSGLINHRSTDGGTSWSDVFNDVHVDQHAIAIDPENPDNVFVGNDGGVYYSTDKGATYVFKSGLPITQFYNASIDPQIPERLFGGTQDNNCIRSISGEADEFEPILGGDGFFTLVDPSNSNIVYAEFQNGGLNKSLAGGAPGTFTPATFGISNLDRRNWRTPIAIDPLSPQRLYYGTYRVYQSDDRANSWTAISGDLTKGDASINRAYGTITTISPSPATSGLVYAGTDDGKVWRTQSAGEPWTDISTGLPNRWVTSVTASGFEANTVYVTFSGYRFGEFDGQVFRSVDQGMTWEAFSGGLPDVPVNEIVEDPEDGRLFLATDIGIFLRHEGTGGWELLADGIPNVVISDLEYHPPTKDLIAGTYGRSLYRLSTAALVSSPELPTPIQSASVFPNPAVGSTVLVLNLKEAVSVDLALYDVQGRVVRSFGNRQLLPGETTIPLNLGGLPSGIHLVRGAIGDEVFSRRLVIR